MGRQEGREDQSQEETVVMLVKMLYMFSYLVVTTAVLSRSIQNVVYGYVVSLRKLKITTA